MKTRLKILLTLGLALLPLSLSAQTGNSRQKPEVKKVLFIGDSMTGWLAERLGAWGDKNGFEVATVVWDGSTIKKWGSSPRLTSLIKEQNPDALFISLGMNDLFETSPQTKYGASMAAIKGAAGDIPIIWIGPPSWPGYNKGDIMCRWLSSTLGEGHYFDSFSQKLPRQSSKNPHPTKAGMIQWMDAAVDWLHDSGAVALPGYSRPGPAEMKRGRTFIYKRMKESF